MVSIEQINKINRAIIEKNQIYGKACPPFMINSSLVKIESFWRMELERSI